MKNIILILLVFILLSGTHSVRNFYTQNIDLYYKNSLNPIADLIIIPELEIPDFLLIPKPTPNLYKQPQNIIKDSRSWSKSEYKNQIKKTSEKYHVDPQIIYATIMTESEGNPYAFRYEPYLKDASLGLGQILTKTAKRLGFEGDSILLYKPEIAIDLIGRYHRKTIDKYGNLTPIQLAKAYNTGSPFKAPYKNHLARFCKWMNEKPS